MLRAHNHFRPCFASVTMSIQLLRLVSDCPPGSPVVAGEVRHRYMSWRSHEGDVVQLRAFWTWMQYRFRFEFAGRVMDV